MATDLVTLAEYKAYIGIASTNQDSEISSIIPKVSQLIKNLCRRTFVDYTINPKTEIFHGGVNSLSMKEYPLIDIISFDYTTDYGQTTTALTEFIDYVIDGENESIISTSIDSYGNPIVFPRYTNGYILTYTAGYATLPEDLKIAVLDTVTYYLKHDTAVHSAKAPGTNSVQIEYITNTKLPAHISRVLDLYVASFN